MNHNLMSVKYFITNSKMLLRKFPQEQQLIPVESGKKKEEKMSG